MATNVNVKVRKGEDVNKAIRRFKKKYEAAGVIRDIKRKRYYMKPSEAKRHKRAMAAKKRRKAARRRK
tara:strand:+ start:383 stop:586 length:204 start_codon:yes stop_codon:yes gene_type:complete